MSSIPISIISRRHTVGDCWIWTGSTAGGYGQVQIYGKRYYVHRYVFCKTLGLKYSDTSFDVLHTCDRPLCFNPEHLYKGTPKTNHDDAVAKGRKIRRKYGKGVFV